MTCRMITYGFALVLAGAGCGGSEAAQGNAKRDAGRDAGSMGGAIDGSAWPQADLANRVEAMPPNVFADAPVYNWNPTGAGGASGGAAGNSGAAGSGGAAGSSGTGGTSGPSLDAPIAMVDAQISADAGTRPIDASAPVDLARPDLSSPDDLGGRPDLSSPDARPADSRPACVAEIVPVVPVALPKNEYMVAADDLRIALRAQVVAGALAPDEAWSWYANRNGQPLKVDETKTPDLAAAAFTIAEDGDYVFTAMAGTCYATFTRSARRAGGCHECDYGTDVQIVSPPSYGLPTQWGYFSYTQGIGLAESHVINLFTAAGNQLIPSYVRINGLDGSLVTDGHADPAIGFSRPLLVRASNGDLARYQVLVVPMDGSGDGSVAATAPQLFSNLMVQDLEKNASLSLSGGVTVTGSTLMAGGQAAGDVRVMLSNQDPAAPPRPENLLFSSVGRSDAQGKYSLHVQPGRYWVTVAPTADSGLSEALDPLPISLAGNTIIGFTWLVPTSAPLTLQVLDATRVPAGNTRVLVRATQATPVGTLTFQVDGTTLTHTANSNVQMEATTDSYGQVSFPALLADATYSVLLIPATPGPVQATTELSLTLPAAGLSQQVLLAAESSILGQLIPGAGVPAVPDWSQVQVVAFDKSELVPEAPRFVWVDADGSFDLRVSPGRAYAVVVWPPPSSGLARTFVGPGLLQASAFRITQPVQATMDWTSSVSITTQSTVMGIVGAALQTTCHPGYWRCIDPTIPLAETTSGDNGTFTLKVPDPATR